MGGNPKRAGIRFVTTSISLAWIFRGFSLNGVEVTRLFAYGPFRQQPLVDTVGIDDDPGTGGLTEDLRKADGRKRFRSDDIGEYRAGSYRGELVYVPHQKHPRMIGDRTR